MAMGNSITGHEEDVGVGPCGCSPLGFFFNGKEICGPTHRVAEGLGSPTQEGMTTIWSSRYLPLKIPTRNSGISTVKGSSSALNGAPAP
jgi:hypothetical protein